MARLYIVVESWLNPRRNNAQEVAAQYLDNEYLNPLIIDAWWEDPETSTKETPEQ